MSHNLRMATVAVVLAFAAMGSANARALNHNQLYPGYAGEVYPSAPAAHFVPGPTLRFQFAEIAFRL